MHHEIDCAGVVRIRDMIDRLRGHGFIEESEMFSKVYWAWLRMTEAYVAAHPYVRNPEKSSMTPISALTVVDSTLNHWADIVPGTPKLNDKAVLDDAARDEYWHRVEDIRMRREAGEFD